MNDGRDIFDLFVALDNLEGDQEMLKELVELFITDCPNLLGAIQVALAAGDCEELGNAAHSLKGSVSSFGAHKAYAAALRLESLAREASDPHLLPTASRAVEQEIARLRPRLQEFLEQ